MKHVMRKAASDTVASDGTITIYFQSTAQGLVETGTVWVPDSPNAQRWNASNTIDGSSPVGTWQGITGALVQCRGRDTLTVKASGLTPGSVYVAWWVGVATDEQDAPDFFPSNYTQSLPTQGNFGYRFRDEFYWPTGTFSDQYPLTVAYGYLGVFGPKPAIVSDDPAGIGTNALAVGSINIPRTSPLQSAAQQVQISAYIHPGFVSGENANTGFTLWWPSVPVASFSTPNLAALPGRVMGIRCWNDGGLGTNRYKFFTVVAGIVTTYDTGLDADSTLYDYVALTLDGQGYVTFLLVKEDGTTFTATTVNAVWPPDQHTADIVNLPGLSIVCTMQPRSGGGAIGAKLAQLRVDYS